MRLEDIGFYTLTDERCKNASTKSPLWRCELLVTNVCNFKCPYCRSVGPKGHMSWEDAKKVFDFWIKDSLKNVRLSGGEPTVWPHIVRAVAYLKAGGVERIAISSNGSAHQFIYQKLVESGANDFSISFDACCAEDCSSMSGGRDIWHTLTDNIRYLSMFSYVTAGVVLTEDNQDKVVDIVNKAKELGVADIRVIPAAQHAKALDSLPKELDLPILEYRRNVASCGGTVRGLGFTDTSKCSLVLDDMAVIGNKHYPCIIYAREGGEPIGEVGPNMREDRKLWSESHNCKQDKICAANCLDVCREYNNKKKRFNNAD